MKHAKQSELPIANQEIGPASVLSYDGQRGVRVRYAGDMISATLAVSGEYSPREGDRVLVARGQNDAFVIGVLAALRPVRDEVQTEDGAVAKVDADGRRLQVFNPQGQLIFEHRPEQECTVLNIPTGNLRLRTASGSIELDSAEDIRLNARDELRVRSVRSRLELGDAEIIGKTIQATATRVRQVVEVAELHAGRVLQKAQNIFRDVQQLEQTRVGRLRMIARGTAQIMSKRAVLKAEEDVSIKGEKIFLA